MRKKFLSTTTREPFQAKTIFPAPTWLRQDLSELEKVGSGKLLTFFYDDLPQMLPQIRTEKFCRITEPFFGTPAYLLFPQSDLRKLGFSSGGIYISDETPKRTAGEAARTRPTHSAIMLLPQAIKTQDFVRKSLVNIPSTNIKPLPNINVNRITFLHEAGHHVVESTLKIHPNSKQVEKKADEYALQRVPSHEARFWISFRALGAQLSNMESDAVDYWNILSLTPNIYHISDLDETASVVELKLRAMDHPTPQSDDPKAYLLNCLGNDRLQKPQTHFELVANSNAKAVLHLHNLARLDPATFTLPHTEALYERTIQAMSDLTPGILKSSGKPDRSYHHSHTTLPSRKSALTP